MSLISLVACADLIPVHIVLLSTSLARGGIHQCTDLTQACQEKPVCSPVMSHHTFESMQVICTFRVIFFRVLYIIFYRSNWYIVLPKKSSSNGTMIKGISNLQKYTTHFLYNYHDFLYYLHINVHVGVVVESTGLHSVHGALHRTMLTLELIIDQLSITPGGIMKGENIRNLQNARFSSIRAVCSN